jgi:predicted metal-dependent HD superfamily phosphohydrolase
MTQTSRNEILKSVETYVRAHFEQNIPEKYVYHNIDHTTEVVGAALDIAKAYPEFTATDLEILEIAAWFHDTGYDQGTQDHEERSCTYAESFLQTANYPAENITKIKGLIRATKLPQNPHNLLEEIICDADLNHLGNENYWVRCSKVREELYTAKNIMMSEIEWVDFELDFMNGHQFHTDSAIDLYDKRKQKHIKVLRKQKLRHNPHLAELVRESILDEKDKKKKKKKKKSGNSDLNQLNLGRGVETMYRTTYRTHVNLSSIADNKANIMLTVNAVIISIVVSNLIPEFDTNKYLIPPTFVLLMVCLTALVFAILSTRPKITEGTFTREDIEQKRSNLLFFGNFYKMDLKDFDWGMTEMIKDSEFLYSSMTRDLYYLGIVLAKKYRFLRLCYTVFMYGLIVSVVLFGISYAFFNNA